MSRRNANRNLLKHQTKALSSKVIEFLSLSLCVFIYRVVDFAKSKIIIFFKILSRAESPAEFFAENKNIAGFDNVSELELLFLFLFFFCCYFC